MTEKFDHAQIIKKFRDFERPRIERYAHEHNKRPNQDVDHEPHFIDLLENFLKTECSTTLENLCHHATAESLERRHASFVQYMLKNSVLRLRDASINRADN